jgi:hypothetical protein
MMRLALALVLVIGAPAVARADGHLEGVFGIVSPLEDDDYDAAVDTSVKIGLGYHSGVRPVGLDLRIDITPFSDDVPLVDASFFRARFLAGIRGSTPIGARIEMYGRAAAGLDLLHAEISGEVFGVRFENDDLDPGLALEGAFGISGRVGQKLRLGGQIAIPLAFHFDEDDPADNEDIDLEYTGIDLDILLTLGSSF